MSLETGEYTITSKANGRAIGRRIPEDRSLMPKRVFTLHEGSDSPTWRVEKQGEEEYILVADGGRTTVFDHNLFAVLLDDPPAQSWHIKPQFHHGEATYTIETNDGEGWVVDAENEDTTQVSVKPLIVGPSYPPFFPNNELFVISRAEE